jgi:hypothetical protein
MSKPVSKRDQIVFGSVFVAAGLGIMMMMTLSPEGLNAPYWVGMVAASTFALAGASVMAQGFGWNVAGRLLAVLTVLCLATPGLWILLDPAEKHCTASIGFIGGGIASGAGDLVCRAAFGFGGAITLAIGAVALVAFVRYVRRRRRAADERSAPNA